MIFGHDSFGIGIGDDLRAIEHINSIIRTIDPIAIVKPQLLARK